MPFGLDELRPAITKTTKLHTFEWNISSQSNKSNRMTSWYKNISSITVCEQIHRMPVFSSQIGPWMQSYLSLARISCWTNNLGVGMDFYVCISVVSVTGDVLTLTHCGRDKSAAMSQTTLSNALSWMKIFEFRYNFGLITNVFMRHSASIS